MIVSLCYLVSQRRYEAEEMASMLNDRNEYLEQLEKVGLFLKILNIKS